MPGASCIGGRVWTLSRHEAGRWVYGSVLIEAVMSAQSDPRRAEPSDVDPKYYYRRSLTARELIPAVGAAVGTAVVAFYIVKLFMERTPLGPTPRAGEAPRLAVHRSRRSSGTATDLGRR